MQYSICESILGIHRRVICRAIADVEMYISLANEIK